jgi:FkbM family methyltransferase
MRGARGLCFEPDPGNFRRLAQLYRCQGRVRCISEGLSDCAGKLALRCDGLLSTIIATQDIGLEKLLSPWRDLDAPMVEIPVNTLAYYFSSHPLLVGSDVLSIDVEGHELRVLNGIDWQATPKPARCIVVETHAQGEIGSWRHVDLAAISGLLSAHGYCETAKSANNTFWLHEKDVETTRIQQTKSLFPGYQWHDDGAPS